METKQKAIVLLISILFLEYLASYALANGAFHEQKNYYPPDPHGNRSASPPCPCSHPSHGGGSAGTPSSSHRPPKAPPHGSGGGYYNNNPPSVPIITSPPIPSAAPIIPTPFISLVPPASPAIPIYIDPNSPPFSCDYWKTHPALIWGLLGYWGNIGQFFGTGAASAFGSNPSLPQALANKRSDGIGDIFREGTAALLNSMMNKKFVFTTQQVNDSFNNAIASNRDAAAQAQLFKKANEGHDLKHY